MNQALSNEIVRAFHPLAERFDIQVRSRQDEAQRSEVVLANETTALVVTVDWIELRPFVRVCRLHGRTLPIEPLFVDDSSTLDCFDVDTLFVYRKAVPSPVGKTLPTRSDAAAVALVEEYVFALQNFASDVLGGDFSVFPALEAIVKKRARVLNVRRQQE